MSRARTAAAARAGTARGAVPRAPRRVSGPVRPRIVPGRPRPTRPIPVDHGTSIATRLRALPDARMLDRLMRSRAWIWMLGVALGGIVAMQVSLLGMNAGISENVVRSTTFQQQNAKLQEEISTLSSGDRIRVAALKLGLLSPDAGNVGYLAARPGADPHRAVDHMTPPSQAARDTLARGGKPLTTDAVAPATATGPAPVPTVAPVETAAPVEAAAPVETAAPVVTAAPAIATDTTTTP